jgi:hypothetical protein
MLLRIEPLPARQRQAQPNVGGLDVAVDQAGAVQRGQTGARLEHDLPELEQCHRTRL